MEMEVKNDDDDRQRTGTVWTGTAHSFTAVVGTGVLALPWSVAQMGWIFGPIALVFFAVITYYTALLLCDCYRTPDPVTGQRNYTYMGVVRSRLGKIDVVVCGMSQYTMLWGTIVGYVVTAATSMTAVTRSNCHHYKGHDANCGTSGTSYMLIFGGIQIILSQFPNLEKVILLSVIAAAMSIIYLSIALYLCIVKFAFHPEFRGTLIGVISEANGISQSTKMWHSFQALGNIAFAYTYAMLLVEIQDTIKSPPPENETMKKASLYGLGLTTLLYVSLGCVGYVAFGNNAPGNILTGFYEPFWLVDIANLAVLIHLIGAFQVYAQPIFTLYETWLRSKWPTSVFFHKVYSIQGYFGFTISKLVLRTLFCIFTVTVAMIFPFFNAILGLLGSVSFWPITVYFPVTMYISHAKIKTGSLKWLILQSLSLIALVVTLLSAVGSLIDMVGRFNHTKLFSIKF